MLYLKSKGITESNLKFMTIKEVIFMGKKWEKGYGFMDSSPRYTFEGRDPSNTLEIIRVVIYQEIEPEWEYSDTKRLYYYGYVSNNEKEYADTIGRFKYLKDAKRETEKLFDEYCKLFPEAV
jgi:hypothetical protein